jgi:2-keto-4-pentenoate hydratase/2-oxohepta-3-ene-1,7-dioic acid hydratase in catechol pathway
MGGIFRLAVVAAPGCSEVSVESQGKLLALSTLMGKDLPHQSSDLMQLLAQWDHWCDLIAQKVEANADRFAQEGKPAGSVKFLPPIAAPGKLVCIGANYHDHVAEMPVPMVPTYPYSFLKPPNNTLRGSGDTVAVPKGVKMMDWEAELAVIIGTKCAEVRAAQALDVVAGYANLNDLSARDWIAGRPALGIDWIRHKAFDGFAPMGPYVAPRRLVEDPQNLPLRLSVNGVLKQNSSTAQMIFGVAAIIEFLSGIMTLYPGDIIATGTAAGVGHGRKPPEYLRPGDVVRMEVGSLGELVTFIA